MSVPQSIDLKLDKGSAIDITRKSIKQLEQFVKVKVLDCRQGQDLFSFQDYQKIENHRIKYYQHKAPHLLHPDELASARQLDQRSLLVALEIQGEVKVSLRVTPRPFELENFDPHNENLNAELFAQFNNYAELGRLVSDPDLDQITAALLTRHILCLTGLRSFQDWGFAGFVAICRPFRLSYFKKFGLQERFTVFSEQRKLVYHFLSASQETILGQTFLLQNNEDYLIKRLAQAFREGHE